MHPLTPSPTRRSGLTPLEVIIPLAVLSLIGAAWWTFSTTAAARYAAPPPGAAVREQARRALNEMADELRLAADGSIRVDAHRDGSRVEFRTGSGGLIVYAVESSKDAARLVRVQDGQSVTLVDGLRPGGFAARKSAAVLTLVLSPTAEMPLQTAVALRSQGL